MDNITPVELPPFPIDLRVSLAEVTSVDAVCDEIEDYARACYEAGARMASAGAVPEGWKIEREPTGELIINGPEVGVVVRENPTELRLIPEGALFMLANALIGTPPAAQVGTSGASAEVRKLPVNAHEWTDAECAAFREGWALGRTEGLRVAPKPSRDGASAEVARLVEELKRSTNGYMLSTEERSALCSGIDRLATLSSPAAKVGTEDAEAQATRELSMSTYPAGLIKFCDPTTALRHLSKRLREAGIDSSVADDFAEAIEFLLARRDDLGIATAPQPPEAMAPAKVEKEALTDAQIEAGRRDTFSTENPFCPCDSKTMRKAVRWAERAHRIGIPGPAGEAAKDAI